MCGRCPYAPNLAWQHQHNQSISVQHFLLYMYPSRLACLVLWTLSVMTRSPIPCLHVASPPRPFALQACGRGRCPLDINMLLPRLQTGTMKFPLDVFQPNQLWFRVIAMMISCIRGLCLFPLNTACASSPLIHFPPILCRQPDDEVLIPNLRLPCLSSPSRSFVRPAPQACGRGPCRLGYGQYQFASSS
jgi:hypothetical protein